MNPTDFETIAGMNNRDITVKDVGISQRAISLGRSIDRLPAGRFVIILEIKKNKTWNTQILPDETLKQINRIME